MLRSLKIQAQEKKPKICLAKQKPGASDHKKILKTGITKPHPDGGVIMSVALMITMSHQCN